jgi:AcrR family transcriptional regulator
MIHGAAPPVDVRTIDGRILRGVRTREAIVRAARALFLRKGREPTLEEIADRADVSPRILIKHFSGLGGVIVAMVVQVLDEVLARYQAVRVDMPLEDRLTAYVDLRAEVCEQFSPLWLRAVQMARHVPEMEALIRRGRDDVRQFAERVFASELGRAPHAMRRDIFDALAMVSDWNNWRYLREACERSPEEAKTLLHQLLRRIITG